MEQHPATDICVIGLGASGGVIAAELAKAGLSVAALEAGGLRTPESFEDVEETRDELAHFCQGRLRWNEPEVLLYNGQPPAVLPWIVRNIGVGGPLHWSCISYRFHESDFCVRKHSGALAGSSVDDWPINYQDLSPYYDRAEKSFEVAGTDGANPFEPPRQQAYPHSPLSRRPAGLIFEAAARQAGYHPFPAPAAILTGPPAAAPSSRQPCDLCGRCSFYACAQHAKGVTLLVNLPEGLATGLLEIRPDSLAVRISVDRARRASSVVYLDKEGKAHEQPARVVVACNNAAYVARLLLLSACDAFPRGLANRSGLVGKNLMFHASVFGYGVFENRVLSVDVGPQAAVAFDDLNEDRPRQRHGQPFIRGALVSGGLPLPFTAGPLAFSVALGGFAPLPAGMRRWGKEFKDFLYRAYRRYFAVFALCEDLPAETNRVELDPIVRDRWGLPALRIVYDDHPNTVAMQRFFRRRIEQVLRSAGASFVGTGLPSFPGGAAAGHVMGTTRMGDDPERSVVDGFGQAHDVPNLFVGGSGVFVTSAGVNPTLTIFALAYRTAERISELWRQGAFLPDG